MNIEFQKKSAGMNLEARQRERNKISSLQARIRRKQEGLRDTIGIKNIFGILIKRMHKKNKPENPSKLFKDIITELGQSMTSKENEGFEDTWSKIAQLTVPNGGNGKGKGKKGGTAS